MLTTEKKSKKSTTKATKPTESKQPKNSTQPSRPIWLDLLFLAVLVAFGALIIDYGKMDQAASNAQTNNVQGTQVEYVGRMTEEDIESIDQRLNCNINSDPEEFNIIELRALNNSYEGYLQAPTCAVESDFMLAADGVMITTHDNEIGGNCGMARQHGYSEIKECRNNDGNRLATLNDFLRVPLSEWYIDLKSSQSFHEESHINESVAEAIRQIKMLDREEGAILMVYNTPSQTVDLIHENNIRAGLKGYPGNQQEVRLMIDKAQRLDFELVCVLVKYIDQEMVQYANDRGVTLVPWETHEWQPYEWTLLRDWGVDGLITDRPKLAQEVISE